MEKEVIIRYFETKLEHVDELSLIANNLLWTNHDIKDIKNVLTKYIVGDETSVFACSINEKIIGLALVSLRHDYVEGCITSPVGYLEGICVNSEYRNKGVASNLCKQCEQWAKERGCKEFASDCELTNDISYNFHLNIGFKEQNRIIHFKKDL